MTTEPAAPLAQPAAQILTDRAGNYYVVPQELADQWRVPEEQRAAAEAAMQGDVQGFLALASLYSSLEIKQASTRETPKTSFGEGLQPGLKSSSTL
jgi:hypothetical protein